MKAASHGAVHDAGQPHVDRTGCHARRPLGGITGAGRRGGSSAAGFRWPSLAFRSQIYYFRSSRESEASTCMFKVVHGELLYRILVVWKVLCQGVIFDGLVEWDSILLHVVEEWSGSNAAIDKFVRFDLGGCKIAVTAISIRSREKVGSVEGIGGVYSGRAPDLALRSLDSG